MQSLENPSAQSGLTKINQQTNTEINVRSNVRVEHSSKYFQLCRRRKRNDLFSAHKESLIYTGRMRYQRAAEAFRRSRVLRDILLYNNPGFGDRELY